MIELAGTTHLDARRRSRSSGAASLAAAAAAPAAVTLDGSAESPASWLHSALDGTSDLFDDFDTVGMVSYFICSHELCAEAF